MRIKSGLLGGYNQIEMYTNKWVARFYAFAKAESFLTIIYSVCSVFGTYRYSEI